MKVVPLALISSLTAGMLMPTNLLAEDDWFNLYGKINLAYDKLDLSSSTEADWELNSYASRLGFKGKGALTNNIEAFYQFEWQVDVVFDSKDNISDRNQVVGVRGNFGEVFIGRHDTPTKVSQHKIDLFSDLPGDIKNAFNGEKRAAEIIQYTTPVIAENYRIKTALITNNGSSEDNGVSMAAGYAEGNLLLSITYDTDVEKENLETIRLMSQYKVSDWQFGFMYQQSDYNGKIGDGFLASAKYKFGMNNIKLQFVESDVWKIGVSSKIKYSSQLSLGYEHSFMKKLSGYSYLSKGKLGVTDDKDSIFGVGIVYKFSI